MRTISRRSHDRERAATVRVSMSTGASANSDAAFALVNYVIGAAVQNAANGGQSTGDTDRSASLVDMSAEWSELDGRRFPFLRSAAAQLAAHDDREQFLAGVDLILNGIAAAK